MRPEIAWFIAGMGPGKLYDPDIARALDGNAIATVMLLFILGLLTEEGSASFSKTAAEKATGLPASVQKKALAHLERIGLLTVSDSTRASFAVTVSERRLAAFLKNAKVSRKLLINNLTPSSGLNQEVNSLTTTCAQNGKVSPSVSKKNETTDGLSISPRKRLTGRNISDADYTQILVALGYQDWVLELLPEVMEAVGKRSGRFQTVSEAQKFLDAVRRVLELAGKDEKQAAEYILHKAGFYRKKNKVAYEAQRARGRPERPVLTMKSFIASLAKEDNFTRWQVIMQRSNGHRGNGAVQKGLPSSDEILDALRKEVQYDRE